MNNEHRMSNYEVESYFKIHNSLFDIRYSFVFLEPSSGKRTDKRFGLKSFSFENML